MEKIDTKATSASTVECSPITLRRTDQVRLVFVPTLVDNPEQPRACVRGEFIYQRKSKNDAWAPVNTASLGSVKKGESYKLELRSGELLSLVESLGPLYRLKWDKGLPKGRQTFVRLEAGLGRFLALGESDLRSFLDSHPEDAVTTLLKIISWVAASATTPAVTARLARMPTADLPAISALLGLANLKAAIAFWEANKGNESEEFGSNLSRRGPIYSPSSLRTP